MMAFSRRTGIKVILLLGFLLQICNALTSKRADQLSIQEIKEELEVMDIPTISSIGRARSLAI
jgi:hypothetical protein